MVRGDDSLSTNAPLVKPKRSNGSTPAIHAVSALCKEDAMDGPEGYSLGPLVPKPKLPPLLKKPVSRQISAPDLLSSLVEKPREHSRLNPVSEKENKGSSRSR